MNSNGVPKQLTSICTLYLIDLEVLAQMFKTLSDYLYPLSFFFLGSVVHCAAKSVIDPVCICPYLKALTITPIHQESLYQNPPPISR